MCKVKVRAWAIAAAIVGITSIPGTNTVTIASQWCLFLLVLVTGWRPFLLIMATGWRPFLLVIVTGWRPFLLVMATGCSIPNGARVKETS